MHLLTQAREFKTGVVVILQCTAENKECVSEKIYGNIFRNDFNLGFHRPKKDECNFCTKFKNLSASEKTVLMDEYNKHVLPQSTHASEGTVTLGKRKVQSNL